MYVGITLRINHEQRDLDLPACVPVSVLVDKLVSFFIQSAPGSGLVKYVLIHQEGNRIMNTAESLSQSEIVDGDHLNLVSRIIPPGFLTIDDYLEISGPALVCNSGAVASLDRKTVVLGSGDFDRPLSLRGCFIDVGNLDPVHADCVSKTHALIIRNGSAAWILDLGGGNGSHINRERLPGMQRISLIHGDVLTLGKCKLLFVWDYQGVEFEHIK
jgi:hypothetical protein